MFNLYLISFITCILYGTNAQHNLGAPCLNYAGKHGICKYEHTCTRGGESTQKASTCGSVGDSPLPLICCPINDELQGSEPKDCPPLPTIPTPVFDKPAYKVAWEKCVANEKYVRVCVQEGESYKRSNTCEIPRITLRISNGVYAESGEFPHMALLGYNDRDTSTESDNIVWGATGSLISNMHILTSAHVLGIPTYGLLAYASLGSLDKSNIVGEVYAITQRIPHKYYSVGNSQHDIALVVLNREVQFSTVIRPICLPVAGITSEDDLRLLAGWWDGRRTDTTKLLRKGLISTVSGSECNFSPVWDDDTMICARGAKSISRSPAAEGCQFQSGGPLMYRITKEELSCHYVVDGIFSSGGNCSAGQPASCTRVSAYLDWIVEKVWPEELRNATNAVA